jgi:ABC-type branched-subunit amino acid transport system ATPase component
LSANGRESAAQLRVEQLTAGYGSGPVIRDVSLTVGRGEIVAVIGPNGSGKSTLLKAITGAIHVSSGKVSVDGRDITHLRTDVIARSGVGYVAQMRHVFPRLTVRENLEMGGYTLRRDEVGARIAEILEIFPALSKLGGRRAGNLSGGEAKMLAIGRVLMTRPGVVILDEPTADLAPIVARHVLQEHVTRLADHGAAVLLVEQRAKEALAIAHWACVMQSGTVQVSQAAADMRERDDIGQLFLGSPQPRAAR